MIRSSLFLLLISVLALVACGTGTDAPSTIAEPRTVNLLNNSQFEVVEVYIHGDDQDYRDVEPTHSEAVAPAAAVAISVELSPFRLTVVREKNVGGSLRGYTTQRALTLMDSMTVEYLDDYFRVF